MSMFGIKGFDEREYAISANAVLGIRDSGKTYLATEATEELFDAGIPSVWFDPIGVAHNLRIPGKGKGYPIVVAGGAHPDLPLTTENCESIVRAAMQAGVSLVLDLFSMNISKADVRRIVRTSTEVLLHENIQYGVRHVFIEEAAEFVPQRVTDGQVFASVEKLVRMGGNAKLGCTLINQRSADLNKSVLELCANVFVHRQKGKNTLLDLKKWFEVLELTDAERAKIERSLPNMKSGECWALLHDLPKPVFFKGPEKNSLHPDRRASVSKDEAERRKPVPADAFVEAMKAKLAPRPVVVPPLPSPAAHSQAGEARAYERGRRDGWNAGHPVGWLTGEAAGFGRGVTAHAAEVRGALAQAAAVAYVPGQPPRPPALPPAGNGVEAGPDGSGLAPAARPGRSPPAPAQPPRPGPAGDVPQRLLNALAELEAMGADDPSREIAGFLTGYSNPRSDGFLSAVISLRDAGLITFPVAGHLRLTVAGRDKAARPGRLTAADIQERIVELLGHPAGPILNKLVAIYPRFTDRQDLASFAGYGNPRSAGFLDALTKLKDLGFVMYPETGAVRASEILFTGASS